MKLQGECRRPSGECIETTRARGFISAARTMWIMLAVGTLLTLSGCTADAGAPRMRLGSLPFPGIFSLYEAADPDDLGVHCAGTPLARIGGRGEAERGTLYTRRAGFIDLSHVREAIDWVRYLHEHNRALLDQMGDPSFVDPGYAFNYCQARVEISVHEPDWWGQVERSERELLLEELAIRAAQRMDVVLTAWHEAATWLGYQTIPGIPETGSSFTWDDSTAHIVGAIVGGRALRDQGQSWDAAVTRELDDELHQLGVVSRGELRHAAMLVGQRWWKNGVAVRRDLDIGLRGNQKTPWLVPEYGNEPASLMLPVLDDVHGRDMSSVLQISIIPARWMMRRLHGNDDASGTIEGEPGILAVVESIRGQMREEWGDGFDQP